MRATIFSTLHLFMQAEHKASFSGSQGPEAAVPAPWSASISSANAPQLPGAAFPASGSTEGSTLPAARDRSWQRRQPAVTC